MDDVEEIKKLKARYFRSLDSKDWELYASVFAEDCLVDLRGSQGELYEGREAFVFVNCVASPPPIGIFQSVG